MRTSFIVIGVTAVILVIVVIVGVWTKNRNKDPLAGFQGTVDPAVPMDILQANAIREQDIPPDIHIIGNDKIRVGLDFQNGGTIGYLAHPQYPRGNLINTHDKGREIQMSFYAGPSVYNPPTAEYAEGACNKLFMGQDWSWNPIGAGDIDGGTSDILDFQRSTLDNDDNVNRTRPFMYVLSRPLQWACHNVKCECTFESHVEILENQPAVKVTATLNNARTDDYDETEARNQELPAMYTNGFLYRLITYSGEKPFSNDTLTELDASWDGSAAFPWLPGAFTASEHWAALVGKDGTWGVGIINPTETNFVGGFSQPRKKGYGTSRDGQTGYIAPVGTYALPRNIKFTYEYYLVVGTLDTIRSFARQVILGHDNNNNTTITDTEFPTETPTGTPTGTSI